MIAERANGNGKTELLAETPHYEQRISDLEARIAELRVARANGDSQALATIDAILRRLTERHLQLERDFSQLRDFVVAQSAASDAGRSARVDHAIRAAHFEIAALKNRLTDYEIALRDIKSLGAQLGYSLHERNQPKSASGPRFVQLKAKGCTEEDLNSDWVAFWARELNDTPGYRRKLWELCYVAQVLYNEGMLQEGKRGLGFACGTEPLPSLFAKYGVRVLATDLAPDRAEAKAWINTNQHVEQFARIRRPDICPDESRLALIEGAYVDMNAIPAELDGQFDFCWSVCSLEHLGNIANGLKFIVNSLRTLKPGGVSVHTAEFNFGEGKTITEGVTVLFQRRHFTQLAQSLRAEGFHVYELDFDSGKGVLDGMVDLPPYPPHDHDSPYASKYSHLKLSLWGYVCTSFSFVVKKPE